MHSGEDGKRDGQSDDDADLNTISSVLAVVESVAREMAENSDFQRSDFAGELERTIEVLRRLLPE